MIYSINNLLTIAASTWVYMCVLHCRENGNLARYPTRSTLRNMSRKPSCFPLEQLDWSCGQCQRASSLTTSLSPQSCHQPTPLLGLGKFTAARPSACWTLLVHYPCDVYAGGLGSMRVRLKPLGRAHWSVSYAKSMHSHNYTAHLKLMSTLKYSTHIRGAKFLWMGDLKHFVGTVFANGRLC